ncbi:DUF1194 domain-containing protein [Aestuariibacter sp. GS-14]|nr:DUF1194 domain-containing protein [Aestuariibacter sp. GS-14]
MNGLPIGDKSIATFYNDYVIGGPGAFVQPASSFADFVTAVINKISAETSAVTPPSTASAPGALSLLHASGAFMLLRLKNVSKVLIFRSKWLISARHRALFL